MAEKKLTPKQEAFVRCYTGNATEAARMAGYKGNDKTLAVVGSENLRKPYVLSAIKQRNEGLDDHLISDRKARQAFWSRIMRDETKELGLRLTASNLLGKSEGDFLTRHEVKKTPPHEDWLSSVRSDDEDD